MRFTYGVIANTVLLAFGVPSATASASVHVAKIFTGGASAASHVMHRNILWPLFWPLAAGGVLGGVLGAYVPWARIEEGEPAQPVPPVIDATIV